ncbi:MAG TPA: hypothetical protein VFT72_04470 [Opitutaceae bacterium]|nr:hypothetical protein [Opitutaceae bacterium]
MSFACPHFDISNEGCRRLKTDCVPGRPGCVLGDAVFATPVEERLRARAEENRRRVAEAAEKAAARLRRAMPPCG